MIFIIAQSHLKVAYCVDEGTIEGKVAIGMNIVDQIRVHSSTSINPHQSLVKLRVYPGIFKGFPSTFQE